MVSTKPGTGQTAILFIDANQYLDLFGLVAGKKLLDFVEKQKQHIFVSKQIADEVLQRKLERSSGWQKLVSHTIVS
jgi:hypothetical protein